MVNFRWVAALVGYVVWVSSTDMPLKGGSEKLKPCYISPLPITKIINPVAIGFDIPSTLRIHPVFHVSKLKPARATFLQSAPVSTPSPYVVDRGPAYTVGTICLQEGWLRYPVSGQMGGLQSIRSPVGAGMPHPRLGPDHFDRFSRTSLTNHVIHLGAGGVMFCLFCFSFLSKLSLTRQTFLWTLLISHPSQHLINPSLPV